MAVFARRCYSCDSANRMRRVGRVDLVVCVFALVLWAARKTNGALRDQFLALLDVFANSFRFIHLNMCTWLDSSIYLMSILPLAHPSLRL